MISKTSRFAVLASFPLIIGLSGTVYAADPPADDEDEIPTLPVVEVETTQADRSQTVTEITREDTEGVHFTNINDGLFMGTPGVSTSRRSETGFGGPNSGFIIRGLQGPHVPVFVDGIPIQVNNHFHSRVDRYSSDMIDRMEITRGASVLKHGASAVAGVVDIYTRKPGKGFSGFLQGAYGTYNTLEVFGDVGYGWDTGSVLFSASDRNTEGPPVEGGDFAEEAHDLTNLNFKATQAINKQWSIGVRASNAVEDPEDMEYQNGITYRRFAQDETDMVLHVDRKTATSNTLIAWHDNTLDNFNGMYTNGELDAGTKSKRKETETGLLVRHTMLRGGGNTLTVGAHAVEYTDDRFSAGAKTDEGKHYTAYVQMDQGFSNGVRVDGGVRVTKGDDFDLDISPEIGVVKKISASLALRARAGKAFRVPRIGETDITFESTIDPEDLYHAEAGINKLFGKGGELDVVVWAMKGDNLIVRLGGGGANAFYDNSGDFDHRGIEVSLTQPLSKHLSAYAAATVSSLEAETAAPQKILDLGLEFREGKFRSNLAIRAARDNAKPSLEDEDYVVIDGRVQYAFTKNATAFIDVDNIADQRYVTFEGFGAKAVNVGRLIMGGVRLSFGQ